MSRKDPIMATIKDLTISLLAGYADKAAKQLTEKYEAFLDVCTEVLQGTKDPKEASDILNEIRSLIHNQADCMKMLSFNSIKAGNSLDAVKEIIHAYTNISDTISKGVSDTVKIITMP